MDGELYGLHLWIGSLEKRIAILEHKIDCNSCKSGAWDCVELHRLEFPEEHTEDA